nr:hypothetical protein [Desulfuromonadales bacterium]
GVVRHRLYRGGIGSGKTVTGAVDVGCVAHENPGCTGLYVAPTYTMLQDIALPDIEDVIGRASDDAGFRVARFQKGRYLWRFYNGYRLFMRSADRADRLRGLTISHAWIDESEVIQPPMYTWNILLGRMRETSRPPWRMQAYQSILVMTTPSGPTGIVGHFIQQIKNQEPGYAV